MPTYEYECKKCGNRFELFQSIKDTPRKRCSLCRGSLQRLISGGAGLLFKGSGFYITDYRSDSYQKAAKKEKEAGKAKPESGGASPKKGSKPAAKTGSSDA